MARRWTRAFRLTLRSRADAAARDVTVETRTLLSARGVARRFGQHVALAPIDLDVDAGRLIAVIGPNGAGKSTLVAILAGALEATEGQLAHAEPADGRLGAAAARPVRAALTAREPRALRSPRGCA